MSSYYSNGYNPFAAAHMAAAAAAAAAQTAQVRHSMAHPLHPCCAESTRAAPRMGHYTASPRLIWELPAVWCRH